MKTLGTDILYFGTIAFLHERNVHIIPLVILYYVKSCFTRRNQPLRSNNDVVNQVHHIVTIIVLSIIQLANYKTPLVSTIIVKYNFTTALLLMLRASLKLSSKLLTILLFALTVYQWVKIRLIWTIRLKSALMLPYILMNSYWLIVMICMGGKYLFSQQPE